MLTEIKKEILKDPFLFKGELVVILSYLNESYMPKAQLIWSRFNSTHVTGHLQTLSCVCES